jgi:ACS family tartrate transporter-like MFS transporter
MQSSAEARALAKVTARIIPFLFLLYIVAYLDRVNVGFAKLQMQTDLKFTDTIYGIGAGIFFFGYFLFEIPSNLILEKVGARVWIARIMIIWGFLAAAMAFVRTPWQFYTMRFLLGVGEAGFFPGMILYLTYWYPKAERAKAVSLFMTATALANVFGGPVSASILGLNGILGLKGWEWLFILEGIPASLLGIVVLFYLTDKPSDAKWLAADERDALIARLNRDSDDYVAPPEPGETREPAYTQPKSHHHTSLRALLDPKVALFCAIYFCTVTGSYGISMWLPQIVKDFKGLSDIQVGFLTAIPYLCATVFMVLNGRHSDATGERRMHVAVPVFMAALGLGLSAVFKQPVFALASLTLAQMGLSGYLGAFWALPTSFLAGAAAAGGIALINSVGNLGGFVGPFAVGYIKDSTHSYEAPLFTLAGIVFVGGILVLLSRNEPKPAAAAA